MYAKFKNLYLLTRNVLGYIFNTGVEPAEYQRSIRNQNIVIGAIGIAVCLLVVFNAPTIPVTKSILTAIWFTTLALTLFTIRRAWDIYVATLKEPELPESRYWPYFLSLVIPTLVALPATIHVTQNLIIAMLAAGATFLMLAYGLRYLFLDKKYIQKLDADITAKYGDYAKVSPEPFIAKSHLDVMVKTLFGMDEDDKKSLTEMLSITGLIIILTAIVYTFFSLMGADELTLGWLASMGIWMIAGSFVFRIANKDDAGHVVLAIFILFITVVFGIATAHEDNDYPQKFAYFAMVPVFLYGAFKVIYDFNDRYEEAMQEMENYQKTNGNQKNVTTKHS